MSFLAVMESPSRHEMITTTLVSSPSGRIKENEINWCYSDGFHDKMDDLKSGG